ncbi:hypothetical protein HDU85_007625 [Gaertneriomyces sp. JEL0708]|nr:hypothetical protein HDU85_007625 [Gaertneriomyces sp. JEL0708]
MHIHTSWFAVVLALLVVTVKGDDAKVTTLTMLRDTPLLDYRAQILRRHPSYENLLRRSFSLPDVITNLTQLPAEAENIDPIIEIAPDATSEMVRRAIGGVRIKSGEEGGIWWTWGAYGEDGSGGYGGEIQIGNLTQDVAVEGEGAQAAVQRRSRFSRRSNIDIWNCWDIMYYAEIGLGNPPQKFTVAIDTGSSDLWIPDKACTQPVCAKRAKFDSSKSKTLKKIGKRVTTKYGMGSATGEVYADTMVLGGKKVDNMVFISAESMNNVQPAEIDGLIGLSFSSLSHAAPALPGNLRGRTSMIENMYIDWTIDLPCFALYLSPAPWGPGSASPQRNSELTIGTIRGNPNRYSGPITWLTVTSASTWWHVSLTGITGAGGKNLLARSSVRGVIDSGTSLIYVDYSIAKSLNEGLWGANEVRGLSGVWSVGCEKLRKGKGVTISLEGKAFTLEGKDLPTRIWPNDSNTCYAPFQAKGPGDTTDRWILGEIFLRKYYQIYDYGLQADGRTRPRVGLAVAKHS